MIFWCAFLSFAIILLNQFLLLDWVPFCYRIGIPFVRRTYPVSAPVNRLRLIHRLNRMFPEKWWEYGTVFHQIAENEIAFRAKYYLGSRSNPPYGLIRFLPEHKTVVVTVYLNLTVFLAMAIFILPFIVPQYDLMSWFPVDCVIGMFFFALVLIGPLLYFSHRKLVKFTNTIVRLVNASGEQEIIPGAISNI